MLMSGMRSDLRHAIEFYLLWSAVVKKVHLVLFEYPCQALQATLLLARVTSPAIRSNSPIMAGAWRKVCAT